MIQENENWANIVVYAEFETITANNFAKIFSA
jgi:hypothetical protein